MFENNNKEPEKPIDFKRAPTKQLPKDFDPFASQSAVKDERPINKPNISTGGKLNTDFLNKQASPKAEKARPARINHGASFNPV